MIDKHRFYGIVGLLFSILVGQASIRAAHAQLVQVGPGFVKAPFVRVYWGPDGSSYVRAPFVGVYSPDYWVDRGPMPVDCQRMNLAALFGTINESARRLDSELTQMSGGDVWRTRLSLKDLATFAPPDVQQPPPEELRVRLLAALTAFDNIGGMPAADWVTTRGSFRMLQSSLREYTMPAEQRLRSQVSSAARDLQNSLTRFATGDTWQRYFALPPELTAAPPDAIPLEPKAQAKDLTELLGRFDMVSHNDAYRMIAALPAFRWEQESLTAYANWLGSQTPEVMEEELPAPDSK